MAKIDLVKEQMQNLINTVNEVTETDDTDLTSAVTRLVDGYERGFYDLDAVIDKTITKLTSNASLVGAHVLRGCSQLESVVFLEAKSIGDYAFCQCTALKSGEFPCVTSIGEEAFIGCSTLTGEIYFPVLETIGTKAFKECPLTEVEFPVVSTIGTYAFNGCRLLKDVNCISAKEILGYAFSGSGIEIADFPVVRKISGYAFSDCKSLKTADCTSAVELDKHIFARCTSLTSAIFMSAPSVAIYMFDGCTALSYIDFSVATSIGASAFSDCTSLRHADFPCVTSINNTAFSSSAIAHLVLRSDTLCSLSNVNAFSGTPIAIGEGYIYVPSALIDSYETATNWTTYANQFRVLEEYTEDGTTTGTMTIGACTSVDLSDNSLTFTEDTSKTLIATVSPVLTEDPIAWAVSNSKVLGITVDDTGEKCTLTPKSDGKCVVTVTCGGQTDTCEIKVEAGLDSLLYDWDFTKSLIDTKAGVTAVLSDNGITQDANGLTFNAVSQYCNVGAVLDKNRRIEIDVASMTLTDTGVNHRFVLYDGAEASEGLLIYSQKNSAWGCYASGAWKMYTLTDLNAMSGKTVALNIDSNGYCELFVDDASYGSTTADALGRGTELYIGNGVNKSTGGDLSTTVITGLRVYQF